MHCLSPKMVCETKIVADEHSIPGSEKDSIIVSASQMWTSSSSSPNSLEENLKKDTVSIREFELTDHEDVRRIFYDGIMERIPNTAFRGLKQQTKTQIIYTFITSSCFWVAVLEGKVVGIVGAQGNEEDNTVELRRMSVDLRYRGKGIAKALGRKVLEFAMLNNYSAIVLGTTAVKLAAHKLYESLGFQHMGVTEEYTLPGMSHSFLERMFFQLRYHRYRLQLREE
ncbi:N-acetylaspartate synthetase-like isoform X2 [Polyodon spathula]|uniref:N-acetylaspartate synthetase-like isoform X2 n=1 Tax=Polyodon spathula TaxID=7913 RepID=UPI001B7E6C28|nr:N-acetylaspartate synthetase-like isoform X2 [Polyodon spathula]